MRAIARHSSFGFSLRHAVLSGAVVLTTWTFSGPVRHESRFSRHPNAAASDTPHARRWFQSGRASWYGLPFQGQATASGEAFDMYRMTCAHRSLPMGALVRVTNLRNHKSVIVRVNDRGPLAPNRIVDLSYAAARFIGFQGLTRVRLDLIDPAPTREEISRLNWPDQAQ
jgi:rare lipoprotein A